MNPALVVAALAALVALATAIGAVQRTRSGRVRTGAGRAAVRASDLPGAAGLGDAATLLQFSTEVCAPCRATHRILDGVAREVRGVAHIDLDLTHRPDLASRFHIMQTPTTLILDRRGVVQARIGGAPRPAELRAELDRVLSLA